MKAVTINTLFTLSLMLLGISSIVVKARIIPESPHNLLMMADHYARPRSSPPPTPKVSPPIHQVARLDHSLSGSSLPPNLLSAASS